MASLAHVRSKQAQVDELQENGPQVELSLVVGSFGGVVHLLYLHTRRVIALVWVCSRRRGRVASDHQGQAFDQRIGKCTGGCAGWWKE